MAKKIFFPHEGRNGKRTSKATETRVKKDASRNKKTGKKK